MFLIYDVDLIFRLVLRSVYNNISYWLSSANLCKYYCYFTTKSNYCYTFVYDYTSYAHLEQETWFLRDKNRTQFNIIRSLLNKSWSKGWNNIISVYTSCIADEHAGGDVCRGRVTERTSTEKTRRQYN